MLAWQHLICLENKVLILTTCYLWIRQGHRCWCLYGLLLRGLLLNISLSVSLSLSLSLSLALSLVCALRDRPLIHHCPNHSKWAADVLRMEWWLPYLPTYLSRTPPPSLNTPFALSGIAFLYTYLGAFRIFVMVIKTHFMRNAFWPSYRWPIQRSRAFYEGK